MPKIIHRDECSRCGRLAPIGVELSDSVWVEDEDGCLVAHLCSQCVAAEAYYLERAEKVMQEVGFRPALGDDGEVSWHPADPN